MQRSVLDRPESTVPAILPWPLLGGVRFFLAVIVGGTHLTWLFPKSELAWMLDEFSGLGAVLGFLVISGFSMAASIGRETSGFYRRRALRILPLYWLAVATSAWCALPIGPGTLPPPFFSSSWSSFVQHLFFLQGFTTTSLGTNPVLWTLSIEVVLYLATPWFARLSQKQLLLIAATSLGIFMSGPFFVTEFYHHMRFGLGLAMMAWAWLAGFIAFRHPDPTAAGLAVLGTMVLALNINQAFLSSRWSFTVVVVACAIAFGHRLRLRPRATALLSAAGDASYPFYLFHVPLFVMFRRYGTLSTAAGFLVAAIGVAVVLDRLYDRPLKRVFGREN